MSTKIPIVVVVVIVVFKILQAESKTFMEIGPKKKPTWFWKVSQWGKDPLYNKWYWHNFISICKTQKGKKKTQSLLYIIYKNQLKWGIDLNLRSKSTELLKETLGKNL